MRPNVRWSSSNRELHEALLLKQLYPDGGWNPWVILYGFILVVVLVTVVAM